MHDYQVHSEDEASLCTCVNIYRADYMLNAVLAALHLLNIRKEGFFFFMESSIGPVTLISQHHERQTEEIYQMLDTDPFAEWVLLPPFWIFGVYFLWN